MNCKKLIDQPIKKTQGFSFTLWEVFILVLLAYFVVDSYFSFIIVLSGVIIGIVTFYLIPAVILTTLIYLLISLILFRLMLIRGNKRFKKQ